MKKFLLILILLISVNVYSQQEHVILSHTIHDTTVNFSLTDNFAWSFAIEADSVTSGASWPKFYLFEKCDNCTLYDTLYRDSARQFKELILHKHDYNSVIDYQFKIAKAGVTAGKVKVTFTKFRK